MFDPKLSGRTIYVHMHHRCMHRQCVLHRERTPDPKTHREAARDDPMSQHPETPRASRSALAVPVHIRTPTVRAKSLQLTVNRFSINHMYLAEFNAVHGA